ncbi:MAG: hypothetical protein QOI04_1879 [Verrucomicrobiota bacterium]|jgi:predicted Zn-dependent protease
MARHVRYVRRKRKVSTPQGREQILPALPPLLLVAVVFGGLLLSFLALNYGPRAYRGWRESRLLSRAHTMLAQQHFDQAIKAAQQALQVRPNSIIAFRILAEATEKQNRADTVAWRAQIARLSPRDLDAQLNLASAALRFGQLDIARRALENVAPEDRDRAAFHVVAGWLAHAQGNEVEVEQHFAAAVKREPNNDLYQFNLAVLQIRSDDMQKSTTARSTLERLVKVAGFRTAALRALLNDAVQQRDFERAGGFAQDLQMSQHVTFADYLLCLDFYRKLDEKKFAALLEKVKPVAARNPGDLALLLDWMNKNGLAADTLKWIEKLAPELTANPPPAISIAEAFTEMKNWSRLKRWTRGGSWDEADYLRLAYQAYAARQSRLSAADAEFDSIWHSAERAAFDRPERELDLARLATKWNLTTEAEQIWQRLAKDTPHRREALESLFAIYRASNNLKNLFLTARSLHEMSPNESMLTANYARLGLILEQNTEEFRRLAKDAYDKAPNDTNCAVTFAFSLYTIGRTAEGIEVLKKIPSENLHDPHAAVYTAVLLIDENQNDLAKEYVDVAQRGPIYSEEKKLLEEALAKLRAESPKPAPTPSPSATGSPKAAPSIQPSPSVTPAPTP